MPAASFTDLLASLQLTTSHAALIYFAAHGDVLWHLAIGMSICNVAGALIGTRLALRGGSVPCGAFSSRSSVS